MCTVTNVLHAGASSWIKAHDGGFDRWLLWQGLHGATSRGDFSHRPRALPHAGINQAHGQPSAFWKVKD